MSKESSSNDSSTKAEMISIRDLAPLAGHRIAIVLNRGGKPNAFPGIACFEQDQTLGPVLRVRLDGSVHEAATDVLICEREWHGRIASGSDYGCHYALIPAPVRKKPRKA